MWFVVCIVILCIICELMYGMWSLLWFLGSYVMLAVVWFVGFFMVCGLLYTNFSVVFL